MDKFLKQIESDLNNKILASAKGQSIIKESKKIFKEVRKQPKKNSNNTVKNNESIYDDIVKEFLKQHPEFILNKEGK
jgi:hypothetical protein